MKEILSYQSVEVCFNGKAVIHDNSFALHEGEILGIVGESGSGKSTLLKAAMGLIGNGGMVTKGDIWFEGKDIPERRKNRHDFSGCRRFFVPYSNYWRANI